LYVDYVIIVSKTKDGHVRDVDWVLTKLLKAGMRIFQEKSKLFKKSVEFLGFIVPQGGFKLHLKR